MVLLCVLPTSGPGSAQETGGTYTNPVSRGFADTFADPSIIKAGDGYWYFFGTSDPLREGASHATQISHPGTVGGEHEFRAATSRNGENFVRGGTWALPAGTEPEIGLLSPGKAPNDPAATS